MLSRTLIQLSINFFGKSRSYTKELSARLFLESNADLNLTADQKVGLVWGSTEVLESILRYGAGVVTPLAGAVGAVGNWRRPQEARQLLTAPKQQMAGLCLICNLKFILIGLTDQAE